MLSCVALLAILQDTNTVRQPVVWKGQTLYSNASALIVTMGTGPQDIAIPCTRDEGDKLSSLLGGYQYAPQNVKRLDGPDATVANVEAWFKSAETSVKRNDCALIVLSLHGAKDADGGYFKLYGPSKYERMSMTRVAELVKSVSAKHVALIVDTCYAGQMFHELRSAQAKGSNDDLTYINMTDDDCGVVVAASDADQTAGVDAGVGSRFGQPFLDCLGAPSEFPVSLSQIVASVSTQVAPSGQRVGQESFRTNPGSRAHFLFVPGQRLNNQSEGAFEGARKLLDEAESRTQQGLGRVETLEKARAAYDLDKSWRTAERAVAVAVLASDLGWAKTVLLDQHSRGIKIRPLYTMLGALYFLEGESAEATRWNKMSEELLGASVETVLIGQLIGAVDPLLDPGPVPALELLKRDQTNHVLRTLVISRELAMGRSQAAASEIDNLRYYGGLDLAAAINLTILYHRFGRSSNMAEILSAASFDGDQGISTELLIGTNHLFAGDVEKLLNMSPTRPATRRQRGGFRILQALGAFLASDFKAAHQRLGEAKGIITEPPTALDENSDFADEFPEDVIQAVDDLKCLDPGFFNQFDGEEGLDATFEFLDTYDSDFGQEVLLFFISDIALRAEVMRLVTFLHNKSVFRSKFAKEIMSQPIYRLNDDGEEYEAKYFSLLESLKESSEEDIGVYAGEFFSPALGRKVVARYLQPKYAPPSNYSEHAFDAIACHLLRQIFAIPRYCEKVEPSEVRFFSELMGANLPNRPDDPLLALGLAQCYTQLKDTAKAGRVKADAKKRWPWMKF